MNKSETQAFTEQQLADWRSYERVRLSSRFNMFDPAAMRATGLDDARYGFVMDNFDALKLVAITQPAIKETP